KTLLHRLAKQPEFALLLLASYFCTLLLLVVYVQPDIMQTPAIMIFGVEREQPIFGFAAILFVINSLLSSYAIGSYRKSHTSFLNANFVRNSIFVLLSIAASAFFFLQITHSWNVFALVLVTGSTFFFGSYAFSLWARNDFSVLSKPLYRNPPFSSVLHA